MKRSTTASLVLMGLTPLLLTACDDTPPPTAQSFATVDACVKTGIPQSTCQQAHDEAVADNAGASPRFSTHEQCVAQFGADQCQQRSGGSMWVPALTGFLIGRSLSQGSNVPAYTPAGPVYRDTSGGYYSPRGGVYGGRYAASSSGWHTAASGDGASGAGSRAITSGRGGFGSSHAMAGHWGG